jgi:hypothetical protein
MITGDHSKQTGVDRALSLMIAFPNRVPPRIEKVTDSAPTANGPDLRDWEPSAFVVTMAVRADTLVLRRTLKWGARLNTCFYASF